jgi:hypothetical protein
VLVFRDATTPAAEPGREAARPLLPDLREFSPASFAALRAGRRARDAPAGLDFEASSSASTPASRVALLAKETPAGRVL